MSDDLSEKMKETGERAKEAIDREDDKLEQVARKAEPHLHEAGERCAEAEHEAAASGRAQARLNGFRARQLCRRCLAAIFVITGLEADAAVRESRRSRGCSALLRQGTA